MSFEDSQFYILGTQCFVPAFAKQLLLSAAIGFSIGFERAVRGKVASFRTFSTISTGSCLFTILSVQSDGNPLETHDITRVAAQIVVGIGFLGGGVISKTTSRIEGITTGALIWLTAALGMACGFNQVAMALWTYSIGIIYLPLSYFSYKAINKIRKRNIPPPVVAKTSEIEWG